LIEFIYDDNKHLDTIIIKIPIVVYGHINFIPSISKVLYKDKEVEVSIRYNELSIKDMSYDIPIIHTLEKLSEQYEYDNYVCFGIHHFVFPRSSLHKLLLDSRGMIEESILDKQAEVELYMAKKKLADKLRR
jgi:hypothetical protein